MVTPTSSAATKQEVKKRLIHPLIEKVIMVVPYCTRVQRMGTEREEREQKKKKKEKRKNLLVTNLT